MGDRTSCDPEIVRHLHAGTLTTDPHTGAVYHHGRRINGRDNGFGYLQMYLGGRYVLLHRVVWIAANGPLPAGLEINHMNSDRADNRLANLELVTRAQNLAHARAVAALRDNDMCLDDIDPAWLAQVREAARSGNVTAAQVAALRAAV